MTRIGQLKTRITAKKATNTSKKLTKVLGTEFNVNTYKSDFTAVSLVEGKINVTGANKTIAVNPGNQAVFDGKSIVEKSFDPNFNSILKFYSNKVDFVQKVKLKSSVATVLKGSVTYMVCNDRKCLPPKEIPFSFKLQGK